MAWSKVTYKGIKPIGWWFCKILCEAGWAIRRIIKTERYYYYWLNVMLKKYNINLYGKKF
jgi:hypothetical protein